MPAAHTGIDERSPPITASTVYWIRRGMIRSNRATRQAKTAPAAKYRTLPFRKKKIRLLFDGKRCVSVPIFTFFSFIFSLISGFIVSGHTPALLSGITKTFPPEIWCAAWSCRSITRRECFSCQSHYRFLSKTLAAGGYPLSGPALIRKGNHPLWQKHGSLVRCPCQDPA